MLYRVTAPPEEEPISLEDVKLYLRTLPDDDSEDEAVIKPLITAAREYCENITGRALAKQTVAAYPEARVGVAVLPRPPILAVESVTVFKDDGARETLESSHWLLHLAGDAIFLRKLPGDLRSVDPIEVVYTAGYEELPMLLRQAMLLLIGHWYENRETVVVGAIASINVQRTMDAILNQYRDWWF